MKEKKKDSGTDEVFIRRLKGGELENEKRQQGRGGNGYPGEGGKRKKLIFTR